MNIAVRSARSSDASSIAEIYRPVVETTTISFEEAAPDADEFAARISGVMTNYPWLVAEMDGKLCGYSYGHRFRERHGYRFSVEVSVYVEECARGRGVARTLYSTLLDELRARGFRRAFAGIALPNDASLALHQSFGFEVIGVFPEVGYKFGRWLDVAWYTKSLVAT